MYKPFLHIFFYLLTTALRAQENLVPNPSFEDTTHCPTGLFDMEATLDWYSPTGGSPDFFHVCYDEPDMNVSVPLNLLGWQWSRTGNAHVGVILSDFGTNEYREYIQCELISSLESGGQYVVEFFVSLSDSSNKACDNIGAYLSSTSVSLTIDNGDPNLNLPYVPQVISPVNQSISDTENWVQISDTIVAEGNERYLTIGVFTDNANTNWIDVDGGNQDEPYYYIDDVSVIKIEENLKIPNVFTPNDDDVNDNFQVVSTGLLNGEMSIYNRWGLLIFSTAGTQLEWDGRISHVDANEGIYYVLVSLENKKGNRIVKRSFVHLLR